jgi:hypothetical protein
MAANEGGHGMASTDAVDGDPHHAKAERGIRWKGDQEDLNNLILLCRRKFHYND